MKTVFACEYCGDRFDDAVEAIDHEKTHPTLATMRVSQVDGYRMSKGSWPECIWVESGKEARRYGKV